MRKDPLSIARFSKKGCSMHLRATRITFSLFVAFVLALCIGFSLTSAHADEETSTQAPAISRPTNGTWQKSAAGWKYLTNQGALTGSAKIDSKTYYLDADTALMKTG